MAIQAKRTPGWEYGAGGLLAAALAAALLGCGAGVPWAAAMLAGINAATAALYGYDKHCAVVKKHRIPETILHLFALAGGSPGAFLGQQLFRHKTRKVSFRAVFWLIVAAQVAIVVLLV